MPPSLHPGASSSRRQHSPAWMGPTPPSPGGPGSPCPNWELLQCSRSRPLFLSKRQQQLGRTERGVTDGVHSAQSLPGVLRVDEVRSSCPVTFCSEPETPQQ